MKEEDVKKAIIQDNQLEWERLWKEGINVHLHEIVDIIKCHTSIYQKWSAQVTIDLNAKDYALEMHVKLNPLLEAKYQTLKYYSEAKNIKDIAVGLRVNVERMDDHLLIVHMALHMDDGADIMQRLRRQDRQEFAIHQVRKATFGFSNETVLDAIEKTGLRGEQLVPVIDAIKKDQDQVQDLLKRAEQKDSVP